MARRPPVELLGDLDVGEGHLDAVDGQLRVPGAEGHGHAPLAAARVEHAARLDGLHLALELLELRIAAAPLDHLAGLLPREHAEPLLEQLESRLPAQPLVLLLLRGDIGFSALEVSEPRANAGTLLGVAGIGARGIRRFQDLQRAVDVLAVELEAHRLDHAVHIGGIERRRRHGRLAHDVVITREHRITPARCVRRSIGERGRRPRPGAGRSAGAP